MNHPPLITQLFSLLGAFLCLFAFVGHQFHWLDPRKIIYNLLNVMGSGILCYLATYPFQAGFWVMEFVWLIVSLIALRKAFKQ